MLRKLHPVHYVLALLACVIGAVAYDLVRKPAPPTLDRKTAEARVLEYYRKSGGDFNRLTPEEREEALRLEPIARRVIFKKQYDPKEEAEIIATWKKRGKVWKNMTQAERARAYRYMMEQRAIPEIQATMHDTGPPVDLR